MLKLSNQHSLSMNTSGKDTALTLQSDMVTRTSINRFRAKEHAIRILKIDIIILCLSACVRYVSMKHAELVHSLIVTHM